MPKIELLDGGACRVHYGAGRGYATFPDFETARAEMLAFLRKREDDMIRDLAGLAKFRRSLERTTK